jgi:hypothetical protein
MCLFACVFVSFCSLQPGQDLCQQACNDDDDDVCVCVCVLCGFCLPLSFRVAWGVVCLNRTKRSVVTACVCACVRMCSRTSVPFLFCPVCDVGVDGRQCAVPQACVVACAVSQACVVVWAVSQACVVAYAVSSCAVMHALWVAPQSHSQLLAALAPLSMMCAVDRGCRRNTCACVLFCVVGMDTEKWCEAVALIIF